MEVGGHEGSEDGGKIGVAATVECSKREKIRGPGHKEALLVSLLN